MSTAFGVRQTQAGVGTTPSDMRRILGAQWECVGVVDGLAVTGATSLAYRVASGVAVCSKGASDGKVLAWFPGGSTPAVAASDASYPRIDVVWVASHDAEQGDPDNLVTLGVTQGTPAATPTAPAIPTYATELMRMRMPAGATTTANATGVASVGFAIPYGSSLGILLDHTDTTNDDVAASAERVIASGSVSLPTDRLVDMKFTITMYAPKGAASIYVRPYIDGTLVRSFEVALSGLPLAASQFFEDTQTLTAGNHTIAVKVISATTDTVHCYYSPSGWAGQRVQVVDAGVVR